MARAAAESGRRSSSSRCIRARPRSSRCEKAGVPVYREIEAAAWALGRLADQAEQPPRGSLSFRHLWTDHGPTVTKSRNSWPPRWAPFRRRWRTSAGRAARRARLSGGRQGARALAQVGRGRRRPRHRERAGSRRGVGKNGNIVCRRVLRRADGAGGGRCRAHRPAVCRDAFGPVVLVGLGGVYAELLDDTAVALAPVDGRAAGGFVARDRSARAGRGRR